MYICNDIYDSEMIKRAKKFTKEKIIPISKELDENNRFPKELLQKMIENKFFGIHYSKEYGGSDYSSITAYRALTELGKGSAGVCLLFLVHWMAVDVLIKYGNEEQKNKYLKDLITGKRIASYIVSEPLAGSDAASIKTIANKGKDGWILNGVKYFCTNGGIADIYIVACKTDKDKGSKGISLFIVEKGTTGLSVGPLFNKMGCRSSATTSLIIKDCIVPEENLIGEVNKGFGIIMYGLTEGRLGMAAMGLGICEAAMKESVDYSNKRKAFGKSISKLYSIQEKISDMHIKIKASQLLINETCNKRDAGENYSTESSVAKLYVSEAVRDICHNALQIFGGHGYLKNNNIERYTRDARLMDIGVGSSEVLKMVVGSTILKMH